MDLTIFRHKLAEKGMTEKEIEKLIDSAQHLSKSDFEFLLRSLGIDPHVVLEIIDSDLNE